MPLSKPQAIRQAPIMNAILSSDVFVERCLLALLDRQTEDEQRSEQTSQSNGIGFSGVHAKFGTSMAKQIRRNKYGNPEGRRLSPKQRVHARRMCLKYISQLADHADNMRKAS